VEEDSSEVVVSLNSTEDRQEAVEPANSDSAENRRVPAAAVDLNSPEDWRVDVRWPERKLAVAVGSAGQRSVAAPALGCRLRCRLVGMRRNRAARARRRVQGQRAERPLS
jgi:hypothetical protein